MRKSLLTPLYILSYNSQFINNILIMSAIIENEEYISDHPKDNRNSDSTTCTLENDRNTEEFEDVFLEVDRKRSLIRNIWVNKVQQSNISPEMIRKVVDWLFGNFWRFDTQNSTIFLCLGLMKVFLKNRQIQKSKLQSLAITCMYVASKFLQVKKLRMETILDLCQQKYSLEEIVEMEFELLTVINFNLDLPTIDKYFELYQKGATMSTENENKVVFLFQLSMLADLLTDNCQKQILFDICNFIANPVTTSYQMQNLFRFAKTTELKYLFKKWMSCFDVEAYLDSVMFQ